MEKIDLTEFLKVAAGKIWLIIVVALICCGLGFSFCHFFVTPVYSAQTKIAITTGGIVAPDLDSDHQLTTSKVTAADVSTSLAMTETYAYMLNMLELYKMVAEDIDGVTEGTYSAYQLRSMTTFSYKETSLLITATVNCTNPADAVKIVNSIMDNAPDYLKSKIPSTGAVSFPSESASLASPNIPLVTIGAGVIGALATMIVIYFVVMSDKTVKKEEDVTALGMTVLGSVPDFNEKRRGGSYYRGYYK